MPCSRSYSLSVKLTYTESGSWRSKVQIERPALHPVRSADVMTGLIKAMRGEGPMLPGRCRVSTRYSNPFYSACSAVVYITRGSPTATLLYDRYSFNKIIITLPCIEVGSVRLFIVASIIIWSYSIFSFTYVVTIKLDTQPHVDPFL
jgi:hypothetical protein